MKGQFTYANIATGFAGIMLIGLVVFMGSVVQCGTDKNCTNTVGTLTLGGFVIGLITIIVGVFIPFFKSIGPKEIRDQLDEERGPTWGTLPKGFEQPNRKEDSQ